MKKSQDLKIVYKPIADLIPYVNNARTHSEEQVNQIASSIKEFGFNNPILIDGENGVIAGHGRLMAAKKLGLDKVPTVELKGLSEAQKKAYILADNKLALNSGWDEEILKLEIDQLKELNFNLDLVGFGSNEIDEILAVGAPPEEDENPYTTKTDIPQYEIKGTRPPLGKCFDPQRAQELLSQIESACISEEEKEFLRLAANRHVVFNYKNIAEYYVEASKEMQELMENSALVIIDFDSAIAKGFAKMSKELKEIAENDDA